MTKTLTEVYDVKQVLIKKKTTTTFVFRLQIRCVIPGHRKVSDLNSSYAESRINKIDEDMMVTDSDLKMTDAIHVFVRTNS